MEVWMLKALSRIVVVGERWTVAFAAFAMF